MAGMLAMFVARVFSGAKVITVTGFLEPSDPAGSTPQLVTSDAPAATAAVVIRTARTRTGLEGRGQEERRQPVMVGTLPHPG
jgi:hypothetical protein